MCHLFETIRVVNHRFCHLAYHQARMDNSRSILFPQAPPLSLSDIRIPKKLPAGELKCRVVYGAAFTSVAFVPYSVRHFRRVRLVQADHLKYPCKYTDRSQFEEEQRKYPDADELIFVCNGYLTDSTFSNLALFDGTRWVTPDTVLLPGTCRQRLLDHGMLTEQPVTPETLNAFSLISFINAMLEPGRCVVRVDELF